jgi:hypothetical protein
MRRFMAVLTTLYHAKILPSASDSCLHSSGAEWDGAAIDQTRRNVPRRVIALGLIIICNLQTSFAQYVGEESQLMNWRPLAIGAGGFLTGIDIAPDGTMVVRADTYGAYLWRGAQWQQLVTATSMPMAFAAPENAEGVYEIRIAPDHSNILYMMYRGYVLKSVDKGVTWRQTNFPKVSESPNDSYRNYGQKMAVDPNNPNIVYVGTPSNGLFVTTNGGVTWQKVSGVPVGVPINGSYRGITGISFDPSLSKVVNGVTPTIFAASDGDGVYESRNGGTTWSHLNGGPSAVVSAAVSSTGAYYASDGTTLWCYADGTWKQLTTNGGNGLWAVAVNPAKPNEITTVSPGGGLNVSYDAGVTWSGLDFNDKLISTDIPWLARTGYMTVGGAAFSPTRKQLIASDGVGVWNTTVPANFTSTTLTVWNDQSRGINNLVTNEVLVPPGGKPVVASWDRGFFYVVDPDEFPSRYGPVNGSFVAGWSLDYASSKPNFLVGIADWWGTEQSGYSTDGGQTWTKFASEAPTARGAIGGSIAASSPSNIVWAPANRSQPYYTLNGGRTWNPVVLPHVPNWSGFDWAYYLDARTVTADRVLPNTFYLYYAGYGVFRSIDGGITWTRMFSGSIEPFSGANVEIMTVPGHARNLFFTNFNNGSPPQPLHRSIDGGTTWMAVSQVTAYCFGFGAPAPQHTYPTILVVGYFNKLYGIWQSTDNAMTWTMIGKYPNGSLDGIRTIAGDPNVYGRAYIGFGGSGYAYGAGQGR